MVSLIKGIIFAMFPLKCPFVTVIGQKEPVIWDHNFVMCGKEIYLYCPKQVQTTDDVEERGK